ncbi:hypothetical protein L1987_61388 [Smallanthus sonchifolius]|uniref:Uncharacterized protein n=1 Tax=Smallanthus sonchifolius TaxID=185202 RepID=A0ACB9C7F9_9ASTR|nr:hypothetical protein L1987_61388 [Smallanthus sonchifolius]
MDYAPRIHHLDYPFPRDNPRHPLSHSRYEQRQHLDIHTETDLHINAPYREERFSPPRTDSFRLQPRTREKYDYLYPSDEQMNLHERVDYSGRDILKPSLLNRVTHRAETSEDIIAHRNMSSTSSLDRIPLTATNNIGFSRSPAEKRASAQYLDTLTIHSRLGRKVSGEDEMRYMGIHEIERAREDYDYKRDLSSGSHKERMRSLQGVLYESEHRMGEHNLSPYESSSRYLKRKYTMEDEENRIPSRSMMSRLDTVNRRHNQDSRDEEWIDQDARRSNYSRRTHKVYDDDDEFIYDPDESIHDYDHHMRSHEYDDKYAKGYSRSSGQVGFNSYHPNRRNVLPRWKNEQIRSENNKDADMHSSEIEQYEPHEDTKEFKQLVVCSSMQKGESWTVGAILSFQEDKETKKKDEREEKGEYRFKWGETCKLQHNVGKIPGNTNWCCLGIAEDLDKVDSDTKRKCSIKSKKEIQDLADAPVKPGE